MMFQTMKKLIFFAFILTAIVVLMAAIAYQDAVFQNIVWIVAVLAFLFLLWKYDFVLMLKDYERAVIFRFGKVNRVGGPGWAVILPPMESHSYVDLRTHTIDIPKQDVITKGNIEISLDGVVYLRVRKDNESVVKSVVEIENYNEAAKLYIIGMIRDIAGGMELSNVISNIEDFNTQLKEGLKSLSEDWGVECVAVEITDIQIPKSVLDAMHDQKVAVQQKLATIERAEAQKTEIEAVKGATETLSDRALSYYYIKALERMSEGQSTKIIFPMELTNLAASISKKVGPAGEAKTAGEEELVKKYAPLLLAYLKEEKEKREHKPKVKKKK